MTLSLSLSLSIAANLLLRNEVEKRNVLENMDLILLIMDEIIDGGIVLETDPNNIANRYDFGGRKEMPMYTQKISSKIETMINTGTNKYLIA